MAVLLVSSANSRGTFMPGHALGTCSLRICTELIENALIQSCGSGVKRARFDENAFFSDFLAGDSGNDITPNHDNKQKIFEVIGSEPPREQQPSDVSRAGVTTPVRVWRNASAPANEGDLITRATRRDIEVTELECSHPTVVSRARASSPLHVSTTDKDDADLTVAVGEHITSNRPTVFSDVETSLPAIDGTPKKDGSDISGLTLNMQAVNDRVLLPPRELLFGFAIIQQQKTTQTRRSLSKVMSVLANQPLLSMHAVNDQVFPHPRELRFELAVIQLR